MHLKREERQFLWKKYLKLGLSEDEAQFRLNKVIIQLDNLVLKLKMQNKPKDYINQEFYRKFEEMCMKIDGMQ